MKIKLPKTQPETDQEKADRLAKTYLNNKEAEKAAKESAATAAKSIKDWAEKDGEEIEEGKKKVIEGNDYVIGYQNVGGGTSIDYEKAKALIEPATFKACQCTPALDEKLVVAMVEAGKISAEVLKKITVHGKPSQRILVEEKTK